MIKNYKYEFVIAILAALLFIPFLGNVHLFDWDEINFAEAAREMIITGDYFKVQIDYKQFWEKPPLFIWMQVLSMKIFGINEFAARFPNAIAGIVTLLCLFRIGKRLFSVQFGLLWTIIYAGTFLTFLYFKSGIIDPWFNLFIFLSVYYFSYLTQAGFEKRLRVTFLSGLFLGLAVLTKGPAAILIVCLCLIVYYISTGFRKVASIKEMLIIAATTAVVCFAWFGVELMQNGPWFLQEFVVYQIRLFQTEDAGHGGPFFYHWVVLLIGCFPASLFAVKAFFMRGSTLAHHKNFYKWMAILFWVVLILFSIVKTKIVHYSSLCYFPLTFLASYALYELLNDRVVVVWSKWITRSILIMGTVLSFMLTMFPFAMMQKDKWLSLIKDSFAVANLEAVIPWSAGDSIGGLLLFFGLMTVAIFLAKNKRREAVYILFVSISLTVFITTVRIVPKIEMFSQGAAIRFYESVKGEDAYIQPMHFKSYAHLFYGEKKKPANEKAYDHEWLRSGDIDKPVYIVVKLNKSQEIEKYPDIEKIGEENGFVFYKRNPK